MTPIVENRSIILSEDKTYCGLVTGDNQNGIVFIRWFKWGYDSPDVYNDWAFSAYAEEHLINEAECIRRFDALPPGYTPSKYAPKG